MAEKMLQLEKASDPRFGATSVGPLTLASISQRGPIQDQGRATIAKSRKRKAPPSNKTLDPPPAVSFENLSPPLTTELVSACDLPVSLSSSLNLTPENTIHTHISPPLNTLPLASSTLEDPHSYIMEVYDKLLAIAFPGGQTSNSSDAIKRCLYRKYFFDLSKKEIESGTSSINAVEDLVPLIFSCTSKAGFMLL